MHNPVRAAREWSQVEEQEIFRQKGRKEEGKEAKLTPELFFTPWRGNLLFLGLQNWLRRETLYALILLTHWNNRGFVHKALLFCSSERSTLKGDIMGLLCGALHALLCHHSLLSLQNSPHNSEWATHTVIAELTQVISSNEESHQLPVILEIYRLKRWKESTMKTMTITLEICTGAQVKFCHLQGQISVYQLGVAPVLGFLCIKWEI